MNEAKERLYDSVESVPWHRYGLLLGTTPQTRIGNRENMFFKYRIEAAVALYKAGKVEKILASGSANSLDGVNEVTAMRDSLIVRGVPKDAIILDGLGNRTLESVVRAVNTYSIRDFTVISQKFHNERALYLAGHCTDGEISMDGFNAKDSTSDTAFITYIREYFARVKVFLDCMAGK